MSMKVRTKKFGLFMVIVIIAGLAAATSVTAQTGRRASNIKSNGNFDFNNGKVTIYSSDLIFLADEIDLLEDTYKTGVAEALDQIGTYFKSDGTSTHNRNESTVAPSDAASLPFGAIREGIVNSQSIPTERTYTGTLPGQNAQTSGNISAAQADQLSLGAAAWVEGNLIIGTGADNNTYYSQGSQDGYNKGYAQGEQDGYSKGYTQGEQDGYNKGYAQGDQDGYNKGYEQGNKDGYNQGISESSAEIIDLTDAAYSDSGDYRGNMVNKSYTCTKDGYCTIMYSVYGWQVAGNIGGVIGFTVDKNGEEVISWEQRPTDKNDYAGKLDTVSIQVAEGDVISSTAYYNSVKQAIKIWAVVY